ncbi:MAG TPA: methylated-DNA--[protein]-cysteine S-methyltransferase [Gemmatimonadota bacterium]|nr:methylated-DNA--[protein]-cysteine S-methyltransferase [Gemmatimonadota bacterium]
MRRASRRAGPGHRGRLLSRPASDFYATIYAMVRRIPPGKATTYGHIAALCGKPRGARAVGWALHALPDGSDVPWHRVINKSGGISISKVGLPPELQRALLEAEGVEFGPDGRVDLRRWGWTGPKR